VLPRQYPVRSRMRRVVPGVGVSGRHAGRTARRVIPSGRLSPRNQGFRSARDRL